MYTSLVAYRYNYFLLFSLPGGLDASMVDSSLDRNKYSEKLMTYLEPVLLTKRISP